MSTLAYLDTSLPLETRVSDLISRMTLDEKLTQLTSRQRAIPRLGIPEYQISTEGAHGVLVRGLISPWPYGVSTVFPQPIGMSCTWDEELLGRIGEVIGDEARIWYERSNRNRFLTLWFPTIDMERDPRWGRNEEAYGEDPFLAGKLAASLIRGVQGDHPHYVKVACAAKHFYGNNVEKDRGSTSTDISERVKHEYYLRVFKYAFIEGKMLSLMTAYNEVNGVPCIVHDEVNELVKGKWGCEGFIVSDGNDLAQQITLHKWCETMAEAIAGALKAGIDSMTEYVEQPVADAAAEALEKGYMTESDIDKALKNIYRVRFRLGQFDPDEMCPYTNIPQERLCGAEHSSVALEASRKSVVLLQNDGILPLDPASRNKLLVLGDLGTKNMPDWYSGLAPISLTPYEELRKIVPMQNVQTMSIHDLCAIYSDTHKAWLRVDLDGKVFFDGDEETRTVFEEIDWGFDSVSYRDTLSGRYLDLQPDFSFNCKSEMVWGWFTQELFLRDEKSGRFLPHGHFYLERYSDEQKAEIGDMMSTLRREILSDGISPSIEAASKADTVLLYLGNHPLINGRECFDRPAITFPRRWTELIDRLHAVNKNIILTLIAGYPYAFPEEAGRLRAVMYASHGEQYVGKAVAETLFGINNPAGRTSMTWYLSENDLPDIFDYDIINNPRTYMYFDKPVQFPFGYGLSYTTFEYSDMDVNRDGEHYVVSLSVKNTGEHDGDEVVQLYATLDGVPVKAPIKQLCGFERINLAANESKRISLKVPVEEVRLFDEKENEFSIIPQSITFMAGASSEDIRLKVSAET